MNEYQFCLDFEVRDYECDLQGVVNNAVYQHYLEHARHVFLRQHGIDFAVLAQQKCYLVVIRVEIDYLSPLRSGDRFTIGLKTERISRLRFGFTQAIHRLPDAKPILKARVVNTAINEAGRPALPKSLELLLDELIRA